MLGRMAVRAVLVWAVAICGVPFRSIAQVTVVKPGAEKVAINTAGMRPAGADAGRVFRATLDSDLERSGWFTLTGEVASLTVAGVAEDSRGRLEVSCSLLYAGRPRNSFKRSYNAQSSDARRLAHRVADEIVEAVKGVPGIASTRIAMIGSVGGRKDLFICDAYGGGLVQVTRQGAVCLAPGWYPDGDSIVYTSFHKGFPDIYRIDLLSRRRTRIVGYPGLNTGADISPDGRSMVLTLSKDGNPELYVMDVSGQRVTRLTRTPHAAEASPSWSPDGKRIVYVSDSSGSPQLYVVSRAGGGAQRISVRGNENVAPDWGPDGRIAFSSRRSGRYQICVLDPDSGEPEEQVTTDYVDHEDPSWARDERHIVYARTARYESVLYLLDTMGDPEIRLTAMQGDWYSPACSPK